MSAPALTVVIPCRDAGPLLEEAVRSVLEQEGAAPPLEVIVVDDRSADPETVRILERLGDRHDRVRVLRDPPRPGPAAARNLGVSEARGEWLAFLDADDLWLPTGLETRWRVVEERPECSFVSADFAHLREDGTRGEPFYRTRPIPRRVLQAAFEQGEVLRLERPVPHFLRAVLTWTGVVLIRRALFLEAGGFDERLRRVEDDHLWIRLAARADLFFVPEVVALYRQREGSLTRTEEPPSWWNVQAYRMLLADPEFAPYREAIRRRLSLFAQENAYWHRTRGEVLPAAREALNAVRWNPRRLQSWKTLAGALLGRR